MIHFEWFNVDLNIEKEFPEVEYRIDFKLEWVILNDPKSSSAPSQRSANQLKSQRLDSTKKVRQSLHMNTSGSF